MKNSSPRREGAVFFSILNFMEQAVEFIIFFLGLSIFISFSSEAYICFLSQAVGGFE